ncbi:Metallo-hydrolase/oxidoreductase [Ramaria rubella]|nr:Metallo-hydrolase/oxidoreductase [Ramaria rubella]
MEKLEALPPITRLSERVVRILGQNPGKFTLQGTNTYLIGRKNPYILVDTGEGKESYIPHLENALKQTADTSRQLVSDIVLTHRHHDHTRGLPSVLALLHRLWLGAKTDYRPPRIHKYPLPAHSPDVGLQSMLNELPSESFLPSSTIVEGGIIHQLQMSQTLHGTDSSFRILHTPGHTPDSICLYFPEEMALFTADTVLGQGTTVFEDLATYMHSLRSLLEFKDQPEQKFITIYPGHGPVVDNGPELIEQYIKHRMEREMQIVTVLSSTAPSGKHWTLEELVENIYAQYPRSLWPSAAHGVHLHLMKLKAENRVKQLGEERDARWVLASRL